MKEAYLHQPVPLFAAFPRSLAAFPLSSAAFPHLFADLRFVYLRHFSGFSAQVFWCPLGTIKPSWLLAVSSWHLCPIGIQRRPLGA